MESVHGGSTSILTIKIWRRYDGVWRSGHQSVASSDLTHCSQKEGESDLKMNFNIFISICAVMIASAHCKEDEASLSSARLLQG